MKCTRSVCQNTTTDPAKDDWPLIEILSLPSRCTGYYCPSCAEVIREIHRQGGIEPKIIPNCGGH